MAREPKHTTSPKSWRVKRRLLAVLAAAGVMWAAGIVPVAEAAVGDHLVGREIGSKTFLGIVEFPNGPGICLDNGAAVNRQVTGRSWYTSPRAAFMLWHFWPNASSLPSQNDAVALAYFLKDTEDLPHDPVTRPTWWTDMTTAEQQRAEAANLVWYSFAPDGHTPPHINKPLVTPNMDKTVTFSGLGIVNSVGNYLSGWRLTYTIIGPAVFPGGSKSMTVTSNGAPDTRTATATGPGSVWIRVTASVPGNQVLVSAAQAPGYQGYVVNPGGLTHEISNQGDPKDAIWDFAVQVSSEVPNQYLNVNDPVTDRVTITAAPGDTWLRNPDTNAYIPVVARGTLYQSSRPFNQSPSTASGAVAVYEMTETWTAPGSRLVTPVYRAITPGFYMWRWQVLKADQPDPSILRADASHDYWMFDETSDLTLPPLEVSSTARDLNVPADGYAMDTITIAGYPPDHTEFDGVSGWQADRDTAQVVLYGPVTKEVLADAGDEVPAGTSVHWSGDLPAVNGTFTVGWDEDITDFKPGCYVFVYRFDGDERVPPYQSSFNDANESFCVQSEEPWVTTATVPAGVLTPGEPVADVVTWGNLAAGDVIEITAWVFPVKDRTLQPEQWKCDIPANEADWPDPIPAGRHVVTAAQAKLGVWFSPVRVSYDQSGYCVAFREQTTDSTGKVTKSKGKIGDESETVFFNEPWVTTQVAPDGVVKENQPVADTVRWGNLAAGDVIEITAWVFPVEDRTLQPEDWECEIPAKEADWPDPIPAGRHVVTEAEAVEGSWTSDTPVAYDQSGYCVAFRERTTRPGGTVTKSKGKIGDPTETVVVNSPWVATQVKPTGVVNEG
ncbi:MAG: hypothetical protein LBG11_00340, partial [Bifidobacteriaceae bacterium]|nr:hypothetical protein [Bifidobacteriaceae bacterium]